MSLLEPSPYRNTPVKLADVPREERLAAAREACQTASPEQRATIVAIALNPGDRVAWIHEREAA